MSSSRRAVGRARPAAVATSLSDMVRWCGVEAGEDVEPASQRLDEVGPVPRPAIVRPLAAPASSEPGRLAEQRCRGRRAWRGLVLGVLVRVVEHLVVAGRSGFIPWRQASSPSVDAQVVDRRLDLRVRAASGRRRPDGVAYLTTRPSTRTVCTSPRWAWNATCPYGLSSGNDTGEWSFLIRIDVGLLAPAASAAEVVAAEGLRAAAGGPVDDLLGAQMGCASRCRP